VEPHSDDDEPDDPVPDTGHQLSLDDFVKPVDWPEGKNWGTLMVEASCTPADITYPTDLKLLNEARESTERIIDDLCRQSPALRIHQPRYDRSRARASFLNVAKQKKPRCRRIKAAIRCQLDYVHRNLVAIDALIAAGAGPSDLKTHWWHKLLVISELYRQQSILLYATTRNMPDRIVNLVQRRFGLLFEERRELPLSLVPRSACLSEMALPSCIESVGIHTMRLRI